MLFVLLNNSKQIKQKVRKADRIKPAATNKNALPEFYGFPR